MRFLSYGLIAVSLVTANTAVARDTERVELEPHEGWVLDYAESRCRAVRTFGSGENPNILILEQHSPSKTLNWVIVGSALQSMRRSRAIDIQFGNSLKPIEKNLRGDTFGDFGEALFGMSIVGRTDNPKEKPESSSETPIGFPSLDLEQAATIDHVALRQKSTEIILKTGPMVDVFKAMNTCMTDLVESWGANVEQLATRAKSPEWTNTDEILPKFQGLYPKRALRKGEQADFHVRVMVDGSGDVTNCSLTDMTSAENFDERACEIFTRDAEFDPAIDTAGTAIPSYYSALVLYRIGDSETDGCSSAGSRLCR